MALRIIYAIGAMLLVGVVHLLAGLNGGGGAILITGALLWSFPYALWKLLETSSYPELDLYLPGAAAIAGIGFGGLARCLIQSPALWVVDGSAVLLGALGSGITVRRALRQRAQPCRICRRHPRQGLNLCPRCDHPVCDRLSCWHAETYRCADCERLRRPLLSLEDDEWWDKRLGARVKDGKCSRCEKSARERDLRGCGRCTRATCARCWDMENGRCVCCGWVMPELPEALRALYSMTEVEREVLPRRR